MPNGVGAARRIPTPNAGVGRIFHLDDATLRDARDAADPISRDDVAADVDDRAPGDDGVGDGDGDGDGDGGGGDLRKISTAPKIAAPNANGVFARVRAGRW